MVMLSIGGRVCSSRCRPEINRWSGLASGRGSWRNISPTPPGRIGRQDREADFLALQQGDMTLQDYVNRFEYLARFSSQNMIEGWKCLKFERGLKHELKKVVTPLRERRFPVLVEQAKSAEHS